uniref:Uncharacterized protein n=1 Tax=Anguilla anguilla TaxID=7936 RepID=A0A0E9WIS9_ANGAN
MPMYYKLFNTLMNYHLQGGKMT